MLSLHNGVDFLCGQKGLCYRLFVGLESKVALVLLHPLGPCVLLQLVHVSVGIRRGGLSLEELVHLVVGLRDHLGGLGPDPLVTRGGVLLGGGVHEGRPVHCG